MRRPTARREPKCQVYGQGTRATALAALKGNEVSMTYTLQLENDSNQDGLKFQTTYFKYEAYSSIFFKVKFHLFKSK